VGLLAGLATILQAIGPVLGAEPKRVLLVQPDGGAAGDWLIIQDPRFIDHPVDPYGRVELPSGGVGQEHRILKRDGRRFVQSFQLTPAANQRVMLIEEVR
jgi:hypothetical protein